MAHAAPPAAVQPQAVSLIKEFLLSPSVAGMAGQSGCSACLRAAVQPALGLPPHQIRQIGSSYDGSKTLLGSGQQPSISPAGLIAAVGTLLSCSQDQEVGCQLPLLLHHQLCRAVPVSVTVTEQCWEGSRLPGGLRQSHGKDQKVKCLRCDRLWQPNEELLAEVFLGSAAPQSHFLPAVWHGLFLRGVPAPCVTGWFRAKGAFWEGGEMWRNFTFCCWSGDGSPCPLPLTHSQHEGAWPRRRAGCTSGCMCCCQGLH